MALMNVQLTKPDYGFTATDSTGHSLQIDIPVDQGGNANGFRPMQTLLAALGGCSGVDIVSILKKQRQPLKGLNIKIDGEREKGKEPSVWESVNIVFEFSGELDASKAYRAAELSINKYCSVAETLRRAGAAFTWTVTLNGLPVSF
ncbi:MAG: OsmC family protein [Ferruginibacter sp.]